MAYWRKNHKNLLSTYLKELEILGLFSATFADVFFFQKQSLKVFCKKRGS